MNSNTVLWFAGIVSAIAVLLGVYGSILKYRESAQSAARNTNRIISGQTYIKEEIIAGQIESEEAVIAHQGIATDEIIDDQRRGTEDIIQQQQRAKDEILAALKANKSLLDRLWEKYPFGFVLYGGEGGGSVNIPFYGGDLTIDKENWDKVRMQIDSKRKWYRLQVPPFRLEVQGRLLAQFMFFEINNPYVIGKSCGGIIESGKTEVVVEIVDDDERSPIWVIGIR